MIAVVLKRGAVSECVSPGDKVFIAVILVVDDRVSQPCITQLGQLYEKAARVILNFNRKVIQRVNPGKAALTVIGETNLVESIEGASQMSRAGFLHDHKLHGHYA
jgi:hypothetical protein